MFFKKEDLEKVKMKSVELGSEIKVQKGNLSELKEVHFAKQEKAVMEFRENLASFWEFSQKEMNDNKNENFFLNREIQKLTNKRQMLVQQIEFADQKLSHMEKVTGYRIVI